jgi:hypothetical protein
MNNAVSAEKCKCRKFTAEEFLVGLGLLIGAAEFSPKGINLFGGKDQVDLLLEVLTSCVSLIQKKLRLILGFTSQRPLTTSMKFIG